MLYALFLGLAIIYNWRKFGKERAELIDSLVEAKSSAHRQMILSHLFYVFIFEGFFSVIVAHLISEGSFEIGIVGLGMVYLLLLFLGFSLYQFFIRYLERLTSLTLWPDFKKHVTQELRVNFALIMLPILIYAVINMTFQDSIYEEWGSFWFIGIIVNILFVSVLTITCSVIIMLRLIPNREISEPEYLEIINKRLAQIGMPDLRVRWIETDIKNAFVAGLKLLRFSNQTLFVGKSLRTMLDLKEFDAVISHELAHVANRHIHKRMMDLLKNFLSVIFGVGVIMVLVIGASFLYWGEDASLHGSSTTALAAAGCLVWIIFNFSLLFDAIRSHEFEADAYAVLELGADFKSMKSALEKLLTPDELPDYLKSKTRTQQKKGPFQRWMGRYFSTHPDLTTRIDSLYAKIHFELPFNHYVSSGQRMRGYLARMLNWKILVPGSVAIAVLTTSMMMSYQKGAEMIAFVQSAGAKEILARPELKTMINSRPTLLGPSLMFYIVKKSDEELIDHFLQHGADKGRTLIYLAQLQDFELFEKYYSTYQNRLSDDEYFLILRKSAQVNFTQGYRYLVNAKRFEGLNPLYKEDLSKMHKAQRRPASSTSER